MDFTSFKRFRARINGDPSHTLRVSMLGPSGVGKTSLLATMYDKLEDVVSGADLQLSPDLEDARILGQQIDKLRALFRSPGLSVDLRRGIAGNADWRDFKFGLGRHGKRATLALQFVDYPGGWIDGASADKRRWVVDLLRDSDAILVPIDAPALMERDGQWHPERNRPDFIYTLIKEAYTDLRSPRLVILCPIRCERYLRERDSEQRIVERTLEGYHRLAEYLGFGDLSALVAVVVAPVQTLGEIDVNTVSGERYDPKFIKTSATAKYNPLDSEQPLRYVLRFAMRLHRDHRQNGYFAAIRGMFRGDQHLILAASQFADGCKAELPFEVVQGHEWLDMAVVR